MDGIREFALAQLDLPGLPERPWREFDVTGVLERRDGAPPPMPVAYEAVVDAVHTGVFSEWRMRVRARSAAAALEAAELVLPEAAGASWTVRPAGIQ